MDDISTYYNIHNFNYFLWFFSKHKKKRADERKVADEKSAVAYAIKLEQANMKAEIERLKLIITLAELKKKVGE